MNLPITSKSEDAELVAACIEGSTQAFEILVSRYQTLVCSVSLGVTGDIGASEDIAQEAFVAAWQKLDSINDASKFKAWVCAIARNRAISSIRRATPGTVASLPDVPSHSQHAPEYEVMHDDESEFVWRTLENLPQNYREPLVLYYRRDQSVSEVADVLELSVDAVKQRLARGREILRNEVAEALERKLRSSAPTAAFTLAVMSFVDTGKTAAAATGTAAVTANTVASLKATGAVGGALGTIGGLLGGLLGAYTSWRFARYQSQRKFIVQQSILCVVVLAIFLVPLIVFRPAPNGLALFAWILMYLAFNGIWMVWIYRRLQQLNDTERTNNTPPIETYDQLRTFTSRWHGRRWISRHQILGIPVIQVAFCDPLDESDKALVASQGTARAWIAIGHRAYGRLFALGNVAVAPVAIGTVALGIVSLGVISVGLLSVGVICVAGIAAGIISFGGVSSGSVALGLFSVGQIAIAIIAAKGLLAIAVSSADGSVAIAAEANTEVARSHIANSSSMSIAEQTMDTLILLAQAPPAILLCVFAAYVCSLWILARQRRPLE